MTKKAKDAYKFAILCEGGRWFACESGDELVQVERRTVRAAEVRNGMAINLCKYDGLRPRPTMITQVAEIKSGEILLAGLRMNHGNERDWIRANRDDEFEVVE